MSSLATIITLILSTSLLVGALVFLFLLKKNGQKLLNQLTDKEADVQRLIKERDTLQNQLMISEKRDEGVNETEKIKTGIELTLKKALKRAEEENFQKNTFLSNLSSEIRTPLNNIIGFSSLLETETSLIENKELFEYARGISESGDRLINLLNNIIDISRIESHDMDITIKPCAVSTIISSVAQLYVFKANDQKIKFNIINKDIPDALADDKVLTKILGGIVDNAIKYTEKGFVNISTGFEHKTNEITIRVKDSGCGIDPTYLKEIFNAFRRESPGYSAELQGTRLGLPIAKRLVEMMDGAIEIESKKGEGTTVTVFLKAEAKHDEQVIEELEESSAGEETLPRKMQVHTYWFGSS